MSPQRMRMIEDMTLAGLAEGTREQYVRALWQLAAYYRRAPSSGLPSTAEIPALYGVSRAKVLGFGPV